MAVMAEFFVCLFSFKFTEHRSQLGWYCIDCFLKKPDFDPIISKCSDTS